MERHESRLFAPYKALGCVCSAVPPCFRTLPTRRRITSVLVALGNVVIQYSAERLRLISISDVLPGQIHCIAADKRYVYAAVCERVALLHLSRQIERWIDVGSEVKFIVPFGESLVISDGKNVVSVFEICSGKRLLEIDFGDAFQISALCHPATYLNKILLGSLQGGIRLVNVKTGKLVHEFATTFPSAITVLEQTPAVDVVAIGTNSGQIFLHNLKYDRNIATFEQEAAVTAVTFRTDGVEMMASASPSGGIALWDLNKKALIGQLYDAHSDCITTIYFLTNEPLMVSAGTDNAMKTWIFDMGDGMPRQLILLEGHSKPLTTVAFHGSDSVFSAGLDGTLRSFSVKRDTERQKFGSAGTMSRAKAKKCGRNFESLSLDAIEEIVMAYHREAAWDNIVCRHANNALITTWTSRDQRLGDHKLLHKRFKTDPSLINSVATSAFVTSCGNYAVIGYSSGHIDCFNIESGISRKTFVGYQHSDTAHNSAVVGVFVDSANRQMVSAGQNGVVRFWCFVSTRLKSELKVPLPIVRFRMSANNSLLAIAVTDGSIGIIDVICHQVARIIENAHASGANVLEFSPDSNWLLSASKTGELKVWDVVTQKLIDTMCCGSPCISASFSSQGEYLATAHEGQRSVYLWANKALFATNVDVLALPRDGAISPDVDGSMDVEGQDVRAKSADLIVFSGTTTARWANLPDLDVIKERNKPIVPPKKAKAAPFFLAAKPTLEGFEFEKVVDDGNPEERKALLAKRSMLEIETSFTKSLMSANSDAHYLDVFRSLKAMNLSSTDFHIRSLPSTALKPFLKMLYIMTKIRHDFELIQAYLCAFLRIHQCRLRDDDSDLDELLNVLHLEIKSTWNSFDALVKEDCSIIKWISSALI